MPDKPLVKNFRQRARWSRFHPYSHNPSLISIPSSINGYNPPSSIKMQLIEVASRSSSLPSYQTVIDEVRGSKWNPIYVLGDDECGGCHEEGSKWNPIYVLGDDEYEGCHEEGHSLSDGELGSQSKPIVIEDGNEHVGPTPQLYCLQCKVGLLNIDCTAILCSHCELTGHEYGRTIFPYYNKFQI